MSTDFLLRSPAKITAKTARESITLFFARRKERRGILFLGSRIYIFCLSFSLSGDTLDESGLEAA